MAVDFMEDLHLKLAFARVEYSVSEKSKFPVYFILKALPTVQPSDIGPP